MYFCTCNLCQWRSSTLQEPLYRCSLCRTTTPPSYHCMYLSLTSPAVTYHELTIFYVINVVMNCTSCLHEGLRMWWCFLNVFIMVNCTHWYHARFKKLRNCEPTVSRSIYSHQKKKKKTLHSFHLKCSHKNLNVFLLKVHFLHHIFCTKNIMFLNNYIFEKKEHNTVNLCVT